jgi:heat shock protein HslJ
MAAVEGTIQPRIVENKLAGSRWQLTSLNPAGTMNSVPRNMTIILAFGKDGQANGHGGCNSYSGSYAVRDGALQFGEITSTRLACASQAATEQEQQYLQALGTASRFATEGNMLTVWYEGGFLNFVSMSAADPKQTYP